MKAIPLYRASTGLKTSVDPVRLHETPEAIPLAAAVNVDIDDTGKITRRKGYVKKLSIPVHSLFASDNMFLCGSGDSLVSVASGYFVQKLASITPEGGINYVKVNGDVYWSSGYEKGIIRRGMNIPWVRGTYVGPNTSRVYNDPPLGGVMTHYKGRVYIAQGQVLWFSEPFNFGAFDLARNVISFPANITMLHAVEGGIWVSDQTATYFLRGDNPQNFTLQFRSNDPAVQGTSIEVQGLAFPRQEGGYSFIQSHGHFSILWVSTAGICCGSPDGQMVNITRDDVDIPAATSGSASVISGKYIATLNMGEASIGIALNLQRSALTQYSQYNFNSLTVLNEQCLGGSDTGLFLLQYGDTDNGDNIDAFFELPTASFGSRAEKRVRMVYVGCRGDGQITCSFQGDETDESFGVITCSQNISSKRVPGNRINRAVYWRFRLNNVNGSDFSIDSIDALINVLHTGHR